MSRKDDKAMAKAMELMKAHQSVTKKLDETGRKAAADNIRDKGGRWNSPEERDAAKKGYGR